jgi:hypothetical protein
VGYSRYRPTVTNSTYEWMTAWPEADDPLQAVFSFIMCCRPCVFLERHVNRREDLFHMPSVDGPTNRPTVESTVGWMWRESSTTPLTAWRLLSPTSKPLWLGGQRKREDVIKPRQLNDWKWQENNFWRNLYFLCLFIHSIVIQVIFISTLITVGL